MAVLPPPEPMRERSQSAASRVEFDTPPSSSPSPSPFSSAHGYALKKATTTTPKATRRTSLPTGFGVVDERTTASPPSSVPYYGYTSRKAATTTHKAIRRTSLPTGCGVVEERTTTPPPSSTAYYFRPNQSSASSTGGGMYRKCKGRSKRAAQLLFAGTLISLMTITYLLGWRAERRLALQLEETESVRDELFQSQEELLLEMAKGRRLSKANGDLVQNVRGLKKELQETEHALEEEGNLRGDAVRSVGDCRGQFKHLTAEQGQDMEMFKDNASKMLGTLATQKFGPGPHHYVQFTLMLRKGEDAQRVFFTAETAPVRMMPVSVFMFLEQASLGLWDATSFSLTAQAHSPRVLSAQPDSLDGKVHRLPQMEKLGLAHLPVEEYHPEYPHLPYTLGFWDTKNAGSLFINTVDNTAEHAGHPCFAKIVLGREVIDRILSSNASPLPSPQQDQQGTNGSTPLAVEIVSVRLLDDLSQAVREEGHLKNKLGGETETKG